MTTEGRLALAPLVGSLLSAGLDGTARSLIEAEEAARPDDPTVLQLLGQLDRRAGHLGRARRRYAELAHRDPAHPHAAPLTTWLRPVRLADLVGGDPGHPVAAPGDGPAALVIVDGVLAGKDLAELRELADHQSAAFVAARVGDGHDLRPEVRNNLRLDTAEATGALERGLGVAVRSLVEPVCARLGLEPFEPVHVEHRLCAYGAGTYFRTHSDRPPGRAGTRTLSFACFVHHEPRAFTGGDLLLHDWTPEGGYWEQRYTRLVPRANRLVVFPSATYHQVTTVCAPTGGLNRCRLVANGHLHAAP